MPTNRPKRPRDPNQLGKLIVDISVGEVEDRVLTPEEEGKNPAAVEKGKMGEAMIYTAMRGIMLRRVAA